MDSNGRIILDVQIRNGNVCFLPGARLKYSCKDGFELKGTDIIFCLGNGEWTAPVPVCHPLSSKPGRFFFLIGDQSVRFRSYCSYPGKDLHAVVVGMEAPYRDARFQPGQSLQYSCEYGYELKGSYIIYCHSDGQWSAPVPACNLIAINPDTKFCDYPGVDVNGQIENFNVQDISRSPRFPPGAQLKYSCKDSFDLEGTGTIFCLLNGEWSAPVPICVAEFSNLDPDDDYSGITCQKLDTIPNGYMTIYLSLNAPLLPQDSEDFEYPVGTRIQYGCEIGYAIHGTSNLICEPSGYWSTDKPLCVEDCGRSTFQGFGKVTHGSRTMAGEWPWTVAISVTRNKNEVMICGGALLDKRTVLTAAHCLLEASQYTLRFGNLHRRKRNDDDQVEIRNVRTNIQCN